MKNRFNSVSYTFFKNPKESKNDSPLIGPGTYETMSMNESRYRSRCSAFISNTGVNRERMSMILSSAPGPGTYRNNSLQFKMRSPSIQFDQGPRYDKVNKIKPGPSDYKVNHQSVMPLSKSITFTKTKFDFENHNPQLVSRNPGPAAYDNTSQLKST